MQGPGLPVVEGGHPDLTQVSFKAKPGVFRSRSAKAKEFSYLEAHNKPTWSIETKTHDHLGRIHVVSPQEVHSQAHFYQVGVCVYDRADARIVIAQRR